MPVCCLIIVKKEVDPEEKGGGKWMEGVEGSENSIYCIYFQHNNNNNNLLMTIFPFLQDGNQFL